MKASRYVKAFEKEVDKWERTLSLILEVIEMILQVQRQWMYLEVRREGGREGGGGEGEREEGEKEEEGGGGEEEGRRVGGM